MTAQAKAVPEALKGLQDVQRLVLKGFPATAALHVGLEVRDADGARAWLGGIADDGGPRAVVTTAADWDRKTGVCLTVGITFAGLRALGVPEAELASFPAEFRAGAAARAAVVGDDGPSRPGAWLPWLRGATGGELHVLLTLLADDRTELDDTADELARWWGRDLQEIGRFRAAALSPPGAAASGGPDGSTPAAPFGTGPSGTGSDGSTPERGLLVHFGYRDGFSQPTVEGLPLVGLHDPLERVPVGALVLGHEVPGIDRRGLAYTYPVPGSPELGHNGSFAAFRILEQDVHAFEQFLQDQARATRTSPELIAAKLCGRWRDGAPLVLRPEETSKEELSPLDYNDFDYVPDEHGKGFDDARGERCPLGAHIRRMNPRTAQVAGAPTVRRHRRLVRRGMPYGPAHVPGQPRDEEPRGLVGLFIGASLRDSYEFLMQEWANDGAFSAHLGRTQDPLLGAHDRAGTDSFAAPGLRTSPLRGLPRFVTARGGAYLFLPSTTALRALARGKPGNPAAARRFVDLLPPPSGASRVQTVGRRRDDPSWALLLTWFTTRRGALLRQLLEDGPFLRTPTAVVVSGYDDVREVLEHPRVFRVAPYAEDMVEINEGELFVLGMDAEPDLRLERALLRRALEAADPEGVREQVRLEAPAVLAVPGPVDVVRFAKAVAARVAVERFGLRGLGPDTLAERCHEVFVGLFANLNEDPAVTRRAARARALLKQHIDELVGSGGWSSDDVLGRLVGSTTSSDVAHQLIGLVVGLVDNVVSGICSCLDELFARPEVLTQAQQAAGQSGGLLDRVVLEVLRFSPPAPLLVRRAAGSWTFASSEQRTVSPGQLVLAVTAGAMLDPKRFPDPESVSIERPFGDYLHFGTGVHRCLGEQVGRGIVVEAVRALLLAGVRPASDSGLERRGDRPVRFVVDLPDAR